MRPPTHKTLAPIAFFLVALAAATLALAGAPGAPARASARAVPSNTARDWYFMSHGAHTRPGIPSSASRLLRRYSGVWTGPRHRKVVYLTFDEADELGTTRRIIGILDRAHIKASFFLTGTYIRRNPGITRSLAGHGHLVCSHSLTHPRMTALAGDREAFTRQFRATERAYHAATGGRLARFFRPPYGTYSARTLWLTERLGYTTVFWSFAHVDYDDHAQPPVSVTRARLLAAACPGALYLLHASSRSNTGALAGVIHTLKRRDYAFATLDELR